MLPEICGKLKFSKIVSPAFGMPLSKRCFKMHLLEKSARPPPPPSPL